LQFFKEKTPASPRGEGFFVFETNAVVLARRMLKSILGFFEEE
jgi:hypothetical protein